jgi:hypothetical protein
MRGTRRNSVGTAELYKEQHSAAQDRQPYFTDRMALTAIYNQIKHQSCDEMCSRLNHITFPLSTHLCVLLSRSCEARTKAIFVICLHLRAHPTRSRGCLEPPAATVDDLVVSIALGLDCGPQW